VSDLEPDWDGCLLIGLLLVAVALAIVLGLALT
jgi:hypothetical protein